MDIGVFLPDYNLNRLKDILATYEGVNFQYYSYKTLTNLKKQFEENEAFLDGYLFSGKLAYLSILGDGDKYLKPASYLRVSEADFYKALFNIATTHPTIDFSRVFVDFQSEADYIRAFIDGQPEHARPYTVNETTDILRDDVYEQAIALHKEYHESDKVDWSFTRLVNILDDFEEAGINYYYFEISEKTIGLTVQRLIDQITLATLENNQIVFGYLELKVINLELIESKLLHIHSLLLEYNYQMNEQLSINKTDIHFEITTSYSMLETITNDFLSCNLLNFLDNNKDVFHLGWGTGESFTQAKVNAKQASKYSLNNQVSSTYICKGDGDIVGPLTRNHHSNKENNILLHQTEFRNLQKKLLITSDRLNKIILGFDQVGTEKILSATFAEVLQISVRSANRILKEGVDKNLIQVSEDRQSGLQGRPRRLYKLNKDLL